MENPQTPCTFSLYQNIVVTFRFNFCPISIVFLKHSKSSFNVKKSILLLWSGPNLKFSLIQIVSSGVEWWGLCSAVLCVCMNNYYFDYSSSYLMKMSSISRPVPQGPPHQQQPLLLSDHFSTHVTLPHCVTVVTVVTDGVQAGQQQPAPALLGLSSHHSCLS